MHGTLKYDLVIKGGMIIDGMQTPRYRGDIGVRDGKIVIIDEFTGRMMDGRRWSDGLHQAVEAKEGVQIEPENHRRNNSLFSRFALLNRPRFETPLFYRDSDRFGHIGVITLHNGDLVDRAIRPDDETDLHLPRNTRSG